MTVSKVTPISQLKVLRGVPLTPQYTDTMTYASAAAQQEYFNSHAKYTWVNGVIPVRDNVIRIPVAADMIYDCNYVMYQNPNFNTKWFYCFITSVDWVNINCCEVTLQTDVLTTWQFEWILKPSFIERMHVNDDVRGRYLEPEPVALGEKVRNYKSRTHNQDQGFAFDVYYVPAQGVENVVNLGHIVACCNVREYLESEIQDIKSEILDPLIEAGLQDNLLAIQTIPVRYSNGAHAIDEIALSDFLNNLDGYVPVNNKLFTYPYNSMIVQNSESVSEEFILEEFSRIRPRWNMYCATSLDPSIIGCFLDYGLASQDSNLVPDKMLMAKGFPQGYWSGIQSLAYISNLASGLSNTVSSLLSLDAGGFVQSIFGGVQAAVAPPLARGGQLPASTSAFQEFLGDFYFSQNSVCQSIARDIDQYFTRWGYQINRNAAPLISGRAKFNYVKTRDVIINGNIPVDDLQEIRQIFDNGITFWHQERGHEPGSWSGAANDNLIV